MRAEASNDPPRLAVGRFRRPNMKAWRPFSKNSPWNMPIPKNPKLDLRSKKMVADLFLTNSYPSQPAGKLGLATRVWSIPVY